MRYILLAVFAVVTVAGSDLLGSKGLDRTWMVVLGVGLVSLTIGRFMDE